MRRLLIASALLFVCLAAHAQISEIYVTSSNLRLSGVPEGTAGGATLHDVFWASGIGGGVTLNLLPLPVVSLGIDVRGSTKPGTTGADTALAGIKLGVHPPLIRIKPYIQGSAGYLATRAHSTNTPGGTVANRYLMWEVLGGVDVPLVHFIDLRLVEVGGGGVVNTSSSNSPSLFSINSGLVIHF
jgi:hypothetical protein